MSNQQARRPDTKTRILVKEALDEWLRNDHVDPIHRTVRRDDKEHFRTLAAGIYARGLNTQGNGYRIAERLISHLRENASSYCLSENFPRKLLSLNDPAGNLSTATAETLAHCLRHLECSADPKIPFYYTLMANEYNCIILFFEHRAVGFTSGPTGTIFVPEKRNEIGNFVRPTKEDVTAAVSSPLPVFGIYKNELERFEYLIYEDLADQTQTKPPFAPLMLLPFRQHIMDLLDDDSISTVTGFDVAVQRAPASNGHRFSGLILLFSRLLIRVIRGFFPIISALFLLGCFLLGYQSYRVHGFMIPDGGFLVSVFSEGQMSLQKFFAAGDLRLILSSLPTPVELVFTRTL